MRLGSSIFVIFCALLLLAEAIAPAAAICKKCRKKNLAKTKEEKTEDETPLGSGNEQQHGAHANVESELKQPFDRPKYEESSSEEDKESTNTISSTTTSTVSVSIAQRVRRDDNELTAQAEPEAEMNATVEQEADKESVKSGKTDDDYWLNNDEEDKANENGISTAAPLRLRRNHELRRDLEIGEINSSGRQKSSREVQLKNQRKHGNSHGNMVKRQINNFANDGSAEDDDCGGLNRNGKKSVREFRGETQRKRRETPVAGEHGDAQHRHNADCDSNSDENKGKATRRTRRNVVRSHVDRTGNDRFLDKTIFGGPGLSQTEVNDNEDVISVRNPRSFDYAKWHRHGGCSSKENTLNNTDSNRRYFKNSKKMSSESQSRTKRDAEEQNDEKAKGNELKHPPNLNVEELLNRAIDKNARIPKGPFPDHRRGPPGPFPEPDLRHAHHYDRELIGKLPSSRFLENRHFNLEEGVRRRLEEKERRELENEERNRNELQREEELEGNSGSGSHSRNRRSVETDKSSAMDGGDLDLNFDEDIRRKLESDLQRKKLISERKQEENRIHLNEGIHQKLQNDLDRSGRAPGGTQGEGHFPHHHQKRQALDATNPDPSGKKLDGIAFEKLENDLNRSGRAGGEEPHLNEAIRGKLEHDKAKWQVRAEQMNTRRNDEQALAHNPHHHQKRQVNEAENAQDIKLDESVQNKINFDRSKWQARAEQIAEQGETTTKATKNDSLNASEENRSGRTGKASSSSSSSESRAE